LDGLFGPAEKAPLRPGSQKISGSFAALTAEAAEDAVTFGTFSHDSEGPPAPPDTMRVQAASARPVGRTKGKRSPVWMGVGVALLFVAAAGAGAALALAFLT
ncbi:MAG TPA: hypothetical protein VIL20_04785, partial [Sandaracinaceae bacterium]